MRIRPNHRRDQGSMFLVVFLAVVVIGVGGCCCYHVHKWAQRFPISDPGDVPPQWTNDNTSITAPAGNATVTVYNGIILPNHYVIQVNDDGSLVTNATPGWAESVDSGYVPPKAVHPVVVMRLGESNRVTLSLTNDAYWTQVDMTAAVTNNTMYAKPEGIVWVSLQRSSDGVTWKTIMNNIGIADCTMYQDMDASMSGRFFYRTTR